ncbi:hypothetical protein L226DRAFT_616362 [Lentinus tigrinus ALCF2SS1-7]|uniref:F-box domain-containing protein n=1 Tax=Lentinus tigrinus ALCF2SS1-6 TaxID=1328759 RepID=A0A5C2RUC9_9APHY|nr:hypothetical protein L227DRAFT_657064 [Lentinus tigrinus ALCF2SS1-6]RPD70122.1 hypothetical protein L226DRAFT_616362 [Lentinus tigrinus ALCF2SS1-7]
MDSLEPINTHVPLDVFDVVLSHVHDADDLRSCALVCGAWRPLARPYLFRGVVYRPAVPSRTFKDLVAFLSTLPEPGRFLRSVVVDGRSRDGERQLELDVDEILGQLAQLPTVTHITLTALRLSHPIPGTVASTPLDLSLAPKPSRAVKEVKIQECHFIRDVRPFRRILSSFGRIDALVLQHVFFESMVRAQPELAELPPLELELGTVFVSAVTGFTHVLEKMFGGFQRDAQPQSSPLSFAMALRGGTLYRATMIDIVRPLKKYVHTLSMNVLGFTCDLKWIIKEQVNSSPLKRSDVRVPKDWADGFHLEEYSSLDTLVLYSTTTSLLRREAATLLYSGILANNWRLLTQTPPQNLRHVELRFQRYGPHWRDTIDELWAIDDLEPALVRWETVDAGMLVRFPYLESFTCVLCDGGFVEQWGPFGKELAATPRSAHSRQAEFDDYVTFLQDAFPRLHAAGRLHFRMSDV